MGAAGESAPRSARTLIGCQNDDGLTPCEGFEDPNMTQPFSKFTSSSPELQECLGRSETQTICSLWGGRSDSIVETVGGIRIDEGTKIDDGNDITTTHALHRLE